MEIIILVICAVLLLALIIMQIVILLGLSGIKKKMEKLQQEKNIYRMQNENAAFLTPTIVKKEKVPMRRPENVGGKIICPKCYSAVWEQEKACPCCLNPLD